MALARIGGGFPNQRVSDSTCWLGWRPACMGRPYSQDLRERIVAAVEEGRLSRCKAAAQFAVGISAVINWVRRFRETGRVLHGKIGGHKPKAMAGEHRAFLLFRIKEKDFTLRGLWLSLPAAVSTSIRRRCGTSSKQKNSASKNRACQRARPPGRRPQARPNEKIIRPGSRPSAWS
jgi:putative transposase